MRNIRTCSVLILAAFLFLASGCSKNAKASRHLTRAQAYAAKGDYDKAEIEYQNVLRLNPTNATAARGLSAVYFESENYLSAIPFINGLKRLDPNDLENRARAARVYLSFGGSKEAITDANFVLDRIPTNEIALLVLVDASSQSNEIASAVQRLQQLRQKAGADAPAFHIASGFFALKRQDTTNAEIEFKKALQLNPNDATAHWGLGNLYLAQNKTNEGIAAIKAAADASPIRSPRRIRLIEHKLRAGAEAEGKAMLAEINQKAPDYIPAWLFKARLAFSEKNTTEGYEALERVISRSPNNFEALIMRADARLGEKKYDQAIADLEKVASVATGSAPVRFRMATAYLAKGEVEKALTALTQALKIDPKHTPSIMLMAELNVRRGEAAAAIPSVLDLVRREPRLKPAQLLLGTAYQAAGRPDDALAAFQKVANEDLKNIDAPFLAGVLFRERGRTNEARKAFEEVLRRSPDNYRAVMQMVEMDMAAGDFKSAAARTQSQIEKHPKEAGPLFVMANIRRLENRIAEAQPLLEKAIELDPDHVGAHVLLANIYVQSRQYNVALQKLETLLKAKPNDTAALMLSGAIHDQAKDYEKARDAYEKAIAASPNSPVALNNLAALYSERLNRLDRAYELARKADELAPKNPAISDTFGWILAKRGDYPLALNRLREAFRGLPSNLEVVSHLGITYYLAGDEQSAREILEPLLKQQGEIPLRADAQKCLDILNIPIGSADPKARALLEQRLAEKPADTVALARLSAALEKEKATDALIALHEKAIAASPRLAPVMARLADLYARTGKNKSRALELARNARNLSPEDPEVAQNSARAALTSTDPKDHQWALSLLQDSNARRRGDAETLYDLALAYFSQGRLNEAQINAQESLKTNASSPEAANANRLVESINYITGPNRTAKIASNIDEIVKSIPDFTPALAAQAVVQQQAGKNAEATATFEKVLVRFPNYSPAVRELAILNADRPRDPKAFEYISKARTLFPGDPQIIRAFGVAAYERADYNQAIAALGDAARRSTNDAQLQFYLGMTQAKLKQNQLAKTNLNRAIAMKPDAPFVADAKKTLQELK